MPQLRWDQREVLECVGVVPETDEYDTYHSYTIEREGLKLLLTLWQFESVLQLSLYRGNQRDTILHMALAIRGPVQFKRTKRYEWEEFLLFSDCVSVPNRFYYHKLGDVFDTDKFPYSFDVEVAFYPDIRISFA
jgi:hypothetical protein